MDADLKLGWLQNLSDSVFRTTYEQELSDEVKNPSGLQFCRAVESNQAGDAFVNGFLI